MAGQLTIDTLKASSGVLATQNGMTGIAKAWVNFDGTGTPAIRGSFNVSSITDNGTGNYTVNFTTAMPNANYSAYSSAGSGGNVAGVSLCSYATTPTTTTLSIATLNSSVSALADFTNVSVAVLGA
jgi:hypothetical protein